MARPHAPMSLTLDAKGHRSTTLLYAGVRGCRFDLVVRVRADLCLQANIPLLLRFTVCGQPFI